MSRVIADHGDVVSLTVKRGTFNWLNFPLLGDRGRGKARAITARRLIELWEDLRRFNNWRDIRELAPIANSQRRWIRRNLYTLQNAGLIEIRTVVAGPNGGRVTEFRLVPGKAK